MCLLHPSAHALHNTAILPKHYPDRAFLRIITALQFEAEVIFAILFASCASCTGTSQPSGELGEHGAL